MGNHEYIKISSELIAQNVCWKAKYLKTLIEVAFDTLEYGYTIERQLKCRPKKYLETVEDKERRQSLKWLIQHGLLVADKLPYPHVGTYKVCLSDYAKKFIKAKEG